MKNRKWTNRLGALVVGLLAAVSLSGSETDAQTWGLLGSAVGAAAGAGIDHDNRGRGAAIGAGIGAVGGYITGNESDKAKTRQTNDY